MATVDDVVRAYAAIGEARAEYERLLREATKVRGAQARIAEQLGVTRESLRQDAMTEEEREAVRRADAERKAALRAKAKGAKP